MIPRPGIIVIALSACAFADCAGTSVAPEPVAAVWNAAVDSYEKGDLTNALRLARQLMLEKSHSARAGELVAKLEYDRGNREEAAAAAQIALRAAPDLPRARRNFARATDGILEARRTRRINEVLKAAEGKDPGDMMLAAMRETRLLMSEAAAAATNSAEKAVAAADRNAARALKLSETWIAAREAIARSVTNETQAAGILDQASKAEEKMTRAGRELEDLDGNAVNTLADAENDYNRFSKMLASPPAAIAECITAQSNAWQDAETFNSRAWQPEALDYTRSFRAKFPAWAKAYEQSAQADTNKPPFTAEDQAKISALAVELEKLQLECVEKLLPPKQELALKKAVEIRELLPKDNSGGGQGGGNGGQKPPPGQDQRQKPDQKENDRNDDGRDENDQRSEGQDEEKERQQEQPDAGENETPEKNDEIEAILKKAQERNDEHEAEKRNRMRKAPLAPNERDW